MKTGDIILFSKSKNNFIRKLVHKDFIKNNTPIAINYIFDNCGVIAIIDNKPYLLVARKKLKKILLDEDFVAKYDYMILSYVNDIGNRKRKEFVIDYASCSGVGLINKLPKFIIKLFLILNIVDINDIYDYIIGYLVKVFKRNDLNLFDKDGFLNYVELFNLGKFKTIDFHEK